MLKFMVVLALGACLLLVSAVWSGAVLQTNLNRLDTFSGPDMAVRLVP